MDAFLRRHEVDIARSAGLLLLAGAVVGAYTMVGQLIVGTSVRIDLGAPLMLITGVAAWQRRSWARKFLLVVGWFAAAALALMVLVTPFSGTEKVTITIGSSAVRNPPFGVLVAFGVLMSPLLYVVLSALHSRKALEDFQRPNNASL